MLLETVIKSQEHEHAILETTIKSQAESMTMVNSLTTIMLSLLNTEIHLDPDLAENKTTSDANLGNSKFKENLHKAHEGDITWILMR